MCDPKSQNPSVKSLRTWRNNIIAHYNYEVALDREGFDRDNPAEPEKVLRDLIEPGFKMLEWCSSLHGKVITSQRFAPEKESIEKIWNSGGSQAR
jgi:hypothetical protein